MLKRGGPRPGTQRRHYSNWNIVALPVQALQQTTRHTERERERERERKRETKAACRRLLDRGCRSHAAYRRQRPEASVPSRGICRFVRLALGPHTAAVDTGVAPRTLPRLASVLTNAMLRGRRKTTCCRRRAVPMGYAENFDPQTAIAIKAVATVIRSDCDLNTVLLPFDGNSTALRSLWAPA